ncbi:protein YELLOW LEAF 1, choloroplastic-like [Abrus precatorius]|uniref:Protein YELLOW LEAF 1, choloroplastic-like n=1 Tax=Abrus precatorius TaxID=3816 RepID=A0A8B8MIL3_ABRPR|nr:protein YELLOW LEAF 1, choloroplastic-like [Abrus precatorius]
MSMESCVGSSSLLLPVGITSQPLVDVKHTGPNIIGMKPLPYNIRKGELNIDTFQSPSPRIRCAAALNTKCAASASATQTVTRNSRSITITPDKVKSPKLDDNGPGMPPRDDDGNGGNGGSGGKWSGGLPLLGILGILDVLKDIEGEWQRKSKKIHPA